VYLKSERHRPTNFTDLHPEAPKQRVSLQRPLPDDAIKIVSRGADKEDKAAA
jgi:hypothetical protein